MTTITLAAIEAAQQNLSEMIATFKLQMPRTLNIGQVEIELRPGEHYAGVILDATGIPSHHVILLPDDAEGVTWDQANDFALQAGGELPTRREQALLFANLKGQFEERYYWSSEQHAAYGDCAWVQNFDYGDQYDDIKSSELRARAVRRLTIQ